MNEQPLKLNLGCSDHILAGWINVDCRPKPGVDVAWNLDNQPWPWADNSADEIFIAHCLEHLKDHIAAMNEMGRILKPGGLLRVIVPHANGMMAHYPGHHHVFCPYWFYAWRNSSDCQIAIPGFFPVQSFYLAMWHHRYLRTWKERLVWGSIERVGNASWFAQFAWQMSGLFPPNEIRWQSRKVMT